MKTRNLSSTAAGMHWLLEATPQQKPGQKSHLLQYKQSCLLPTLLDCLAWRSRTCQTFCRDIELPVWAEFCKPCKAANCSLNWTASRLALSARSASFTSTAECCSSFLSSCQRRNPRNYWIYTSMTAEGHMSSVHSMASEQMACLGSDAAISSVSFNRSLIS